MRTIVIDPFDRSVQYFETDLALPELYRVVGEPGLDFCRPFAGYPREVLIVGDHSALQMPPLPRFFVERYHDPLYGKAIVYGVTADGKELPTKLTVEQVYELITFEELL